MRSRLVIGLLGVLCLATAACVVVDGGAGGARPPHAQSAGPPPHAPAHGYRQKHGGHELVFDSSLGVYAVVDLREVWFLDGDYFRLNGDHWEIGVAIDGPWRVAASSAVPERLRAKRHPHGGPPGQQKKGYR
ncbi:MAG TPA: hypothetical protein VII78_05570 [Myxococcota bacterium]|jgi:hypothetical protein